MMTDALFGLGFTIQLTRAADRGTNVTAVYLRRVAIPSAIGIAHMLLVWNGDVLHMYALLGLVLLAIRRVSDRTVGVLILLGFIRQFRGAVALPADACLRYGSAAPHRPAAASS